MKVSPIFYDNHCLECHREKTKSNENTFVDGFCSSYCNEMYFDESFNDISDYRMSKGLVCEPYGRNCPCVYRESLKLARKQNFAACMEEIRYVPSLSSKIIFDCTIHELNLRFRR